MHYKKIIFILFLLQTTWCQLFLNRSLGGDSFLNSARSNAMGGTYSVSLKTSGLTLQNPAGMLRLPAGGYIDISTGVFSALERRSILLKDFFGDYLAMGDYVATRSAYTYFQGGIIKRKNRGNFQTALSVMYSPLTTFNYTYSEEVRSKQSFGDGVIGSKDPLAGFHTLETSGTLELYSFGFALGWKDDLAFHLGIGWHIPFPSVFHDKIRVDSLYTTEDLGNLSSVAEYDTSYTLPAKFIDETLLSFNSDDVFDESFLTLSLDMDITPTIRFTVSAETPLRLETDSSFAYPGDSTYGLPSLTSIDAESGEVFFTPSGIQYLKPEKFRLGLQYTPKSVNLSMLSLEWEQVHYSTVKITNIYVKNTNTLKIGFEYLALKSIPVRAGLIFKEMSFEVLDPLSILTFGTGKSFGNIIIDIAGQYSLYSYQYPDLFPVEGDIRPDFDTVNESRFNFFTTVKYLW